MIKLHFKKLQFHQIHRLEILFNTKIKKMKNKAHKKKRNRKKCNSKDKIIFCLCNKVSNI